jgi:hypothetical protein
MSSVTHVSGKSPEVYDEVRCGRHWPMTADQRIVALLAQLADRDTVIADERRARHKLECELREARGRLDAVAMAILSPTSRVSNQS